MDLATISLIALVLVVLLSCTTHANVGLLALGLAWIIGVYLAPVYGYTFTAGAVASWFPVELFLTLAGVTLLFTMVQQNGSLGLVTQWGTRACRGRSALVPIAFFVLATVVSASGAGNIPTAALLASSGMATARRLGLSPLVMMVMVGHGSIAGTLSPLCPMGIIADEKLTQMGLGGHAGYTFAMNLLANALVAGAGYVLLRGWCVLPTPSQGEAADGTPSTLTVSRTRLATLALLGLLLIGVLGFSMHVGLAAMAAATLLMLTGLAGERDALRDMPWNVLLMVCGVSVLVTLCERTGGLKLFSDWLAACATPRTITPWMAGITGLVSVFSSTSGVVLPTFLPTAPDVLAAVGGGAEPSRLLAVATAINVGSNLVDVSSVSTIGALCVAAAPDEVVRRQLFRQGLAWGLSMTLVAALFCWVVL
jgi:di/tricarboxylate transporter